MNPAIIALDLGTTAFKCGVIAQDGQLVDAPFVAPYELAQSGSRTQCDPQLYLDMVFDLVAKAANSARRQRLEVKAIGISSQAQTFIPVDMAGKPLDHAVVWLDDVACQESMELAEQFTDFHLHSGFPKSSPQLFLPKIMWLRRHAALLFKKTDKFLLINEFVIKHLTGRSYGDSTLQGMGGFFDIRKRTLSSKALKLSAITSERLAEIHPAATFAVSFKHPIAKRFGLKAVDVFSCGNDQCCAAVGAGIIRKGQVLCNFGTAMVVFTPRPTLSPTLKANQISGINPLDDKYFLLGFESECGAVMAWAHDTLFSGTDYDEMIQLSLEVPPLPGTTLFKPHGDGSFDLKDVSVRNDRRIICRSMLDYYADAFVKLLRGISGSSTIHPIASGGLSASKAWLDHLSIRAGLKFTKAQCGHAGLLGVAKIINRE